MVIIENKSGGGILNNLFPLTLPHSAFGQLWDDRTFNVGRRVLTTLPGFIRGRHEYLSLGGYFRCFAHGGVEGCNRPPAVPTPSGGLLG